MSEHPRVQGVVTVQGRDISDLINREADANGFPPRCLVALGIAESNLDEHAWRDGVWPDKSAGLFQQTVRYAPIGDLTASPANIAHVRQVFTTDIPYATGVAARQLGHYYRLHGSYEEAVSRYNGGPNMPWARNPNRANYTQAWARSAAYVGDEEGGMAWAPADVRDEFPYAPGREYARRSLARIAQAVYHHGASATPAPTYDAEIAMLQAYHRLHTATHGWPAIGYHLAVGPSGTVYWLNGLDLITYHAGEANATSVGICLIGDYSARAPSAAMIDAARRARGWVAQQVGAADLPFSGHRDHMATTCPGGWWPEHRDWLDGLPDEATPIPEPEEPEEPTPDPWAEVARLNEELAAERSWSGATVHDILRPSVADLDAALAGTFTAAKRALVVIVRDRLRAWAGEE